jgi:segregation and condensation protein A
MTRQLEPRNHGNAPVPIAQVAGAPLLELPTDLYIPPDALEVVLETFEGPLDLLLYLIRRQNLDILDIRVAEVTRQYMEYIGLMGALQLELAGEYLLMAALLAEIKSRMLLPRSSVVEEDEDDPRAQLIRRLQEYERFKTAAEHIQDMPRMERDVFAVATARPQLVQEQAQPHVEMSELLVALAQALSRAEMFQHHSVQLEPMSVRDRMTDVLAQVNAVPDEFVPFVSLFRVGEHRMGVIVSFLAVMELLREGLVDLVQREPYAPIYLRSAQA